MWTLGKCALRFLMGGSLLVAVGSASLKAQGPATAHVDAHGKPPYNIVFLIVDQRAYRLLAEGDYSLPAIDAIARHGVTFQNHYIASAMCSPSRAAFLAGQPPQVTGVFDQMEYAFVPSLSPRLPNMGSAFKAFGYETAFFGKFEMDKELLRPTANVNYTKAVQTYGFDTFSAGGDIGSNPDSGFDNDAYIAGESVRWLRVAAEKARGTGRPFFMVASFLNPHDIMYANANIPGQPPVQKAVTPQATPPNPANSIYERQWSFSLPESLQQSLTAPGVPRALREYKEGWDGWSGSIPTDRPDMWRKFYNYYLNANQDVDHSIQQIIDTLNEMELWRDTVVVFTADHGEMAGAHGGLKGKGPFSYEENAHVPLVVAHPAGIAGATCAALTSHLDLLPTFVGLTGLPDDKRSPEIKALPGHDFSALLAAPEKASLTAIRPAVLFNYVGISTVDGEYLKMAMSNGFLHKQRPSLARIDMSKRGFLSFVFDGRYKFARYYAPNHFNTPRTLPEIVKSNDIELFDLQNDPHETRNMATEPTQHEALIMRMNGLLNDLMAKEVGVNDGRFLTRLMKGK
jgi:arylsulfatase A-like enzyme